MNEAFSPLVSSPDVNRGGDRVKRMDSDTRAMERQKYVDKGEAIGLSEDDVHRLLAAERRRMALDVLAGGGPWGLEELAEAIVERERHGDVTEHAVSRAMVDLYHAHLPLMADLGAIEYDRRERRVVGCRIGLEVA